MHEAVDSVEECRDRRLRPDIELRGQEKVISEKHCFILFFFSDKLSICKTYDFRKTFIPDAFKHVQLQNTINRCKVHQILPLMVDYTCFSVKSINYQNVM